MDHKNPQDGGITVGEGVKPDNHQCCLRNVGVGSLGRTWRFDGRLTGHGRQHDIRIEHIVTLQPSAPASTGNRSASISAYLLKHPPALTPADGTKLDRI